MKNVKIYDIKSSAAKNAEQLLSPNEEYFFWDNNQFTSNDIGDVIFFVNKTGKWALFTKLVDKNIQTEFDEDKEERYFDFEGYDYVAKDANQQYDTFYQFNVFRKVQIPENWNWTKQLGIVQIYDLWRNDKELTKISDRLDKVTDLQKLFSNGEPAKILDQTANELKNVSQQQGIEYDDSINNPKASLKLINKYHNLLLAIKTKPFIILAGLSGTGKSRLVRTIAYKTCPDKQGLQDDDSKPGNFELIKVRPNWHDSTEVVGYESHLNGKHYIVTEFIRFIVKAWKHPEVPFFLCLDEMNLAPVEQYFAEYLSVFETRKKLDNGEIKTDAILPAPIFQDYEKQLEEKLSLTSDLLQQFKSIGITLPKNLVVMGTVNMDETTHSFSHKVLDRAMTIEKNDFNLKSGLQEGNSDWEYVDQPLALKQVIGSKISGSDVYTEFSKSKEVISFLNNVNDRLKEAKATSFLATYRVRDEFLIYCYHFSELNEKPDNWLTIALDQMMHMKILPKIEGEAEQTKAPLEKLKTIAIQRNLQKSLTKIGQMLEKLDRQRYTSYWY